MQLNRENYEIYLIDYLEGKLDDAAVNELKQFLSQHPDIQEEFRLIEGSQEARLSEMEPIEMDFAFLKKPESQVILDEEMIAAIEGDLNRVELENFRKKLLLYPQNQPAYELFKRSKLPVETLVFENKEILKKKVARIIPMYYRYAAIAAVFVAVAFFFLLNRTQYQSQSNTQTAAITPLPKVMEKTPEKPVQAVAPKSTKANSVRTEKRIIEPDVETMVVEYVQTIEPKTLKVAIGKSSIGPEQQVANQSLLARTERTPSPQGNDGYLTPSQWIKGKVTRQLPESAMALVEKTTGITYKDKSNESGGIKGYAIVSKYFAYERITHP